MMHKCIKTTHAHRFSLEVFTRKHQCPSNRVNSGSNRVNSGSNRVNSGSNWVSKVKLEKMESPQTYTRQLLIRSRVLDQLHQRRTAGVQGVRIGQNHG